MKTTNESIEMFNEMSNKGMEAMQQLGEINLRAMEKLVCRQMDVMSMVMEGSLRQVSLAGEAKGYSDIFKGNVELAKELTERLVNESRENVKLASDTRDEYRTWFEKGVSTLSENVSKAQA